MTLEQSIDLIDEIGETQWFNNYPLGWAMAGNTPCKFYKQNTHGGGVRDPLVIHWPAGLPDGAAGTIREQFHHVTDLTPTVLDLIEVALPDTVNGIDQMPLHGTSMTYSFAEPEAPTRKLVQYFEMLGHRGIVADGWKAVTVHDPRTLIDDDVWELYHLDEDFSELHDMAESRPDLLEELVAQWWDEAARHGVLPIDARAGGGSRPRRPVRRTWTLWPGVERVPSDAAPLVRNTNHTISAYITVPEGGCEGALISDGDRWGGYAMFVQEGSACFHYHFPLERHEVRAAETLPPGDHEITWSLERVGRTAATGVLSVDGTVVGSVEIPRILRGWMPFSGMNVGCDNGAPVGTTYESPFRFTGTLHRVEVDLGGEQPATDQRSEHRAEMGKQ
jgi:arylsulfatase